MMGVSSISFIQIFVIKLEQKLEEKLDEKFGHYFGLIQESFLGQTKMINEKLDMHIEKDRERWLDR
jgi:hypothetical protein